uniref:9-cis-epoxycarotenoid dioxygenase n=1 Tax=Ananas comosus var. bracteatus TaxID=296719 RepID=A0A6V7QFC9_ANACO|nr:unnamed protein product [Ananas comosus var. bracteatus]
MWDVGCGMWDVQQMRGGPWLVAQPFRIQQQQRLILYALRIANRALRGSIGLDPRTFREAHRPPRHRQQQQLPAERFFPAVRSEPARDHHPLLPRELPPPPPPFIKLAAAALDAVEDGVIAGVLERPHPLPRTADPAVQIAGNFAPVGEQAPRHELPVSGRIPPFIKRRVRAERGQPPLLPVAGHHLFDGDGMVHAVRLRNGGASYACRFTQTERLLQERAVGRPLFPKAIGELHGHSGIARLLLFFARGLCGIVDPPAHRRRQRRARLLRRPPPGHVGGRPPLPRENYGRRRSGDRGEVRLRRAAGQLDDRAPEDRPGEQGAVRAELRRDPEAVPPVLPGVAGRAQVGRRGDPLEQPTMMHDFAITERFVVVPDQQVVFKLQEMIRGGSPVVYDREKASRFGILPKYASDASELRWVEVPDCFCFHLWNAWEEPETGEVVVIGSCMTPPDSVFNESDESLKSVLSEIRLDPRTGKSTRRAILDPADQLNLEAGW